MAGMIPGCRMEGLAGRAPSRRHRWWVALKRGGYILAIAFAFRFSNWLASIPHSTWIEFTKVDILNCMGVGLAILAVCGIFEGAVRVRVAAGVGLAIALVSPIVANLDWSGPPPLL